MATRTRRATGRPKISEDQLQDAVVEFAETFGWFVFWVPNWLYRLAVQAMARKRRGDRQWSPPGFPDLVLLQGLADEREPVRLIFAELKSDSGKFSSAEQYDWVRGLRRVPGIEVYVWFASDWTDGTIQRIMQNGPMRDHANTIRMLKRQRPKERER